MTRRTLSLIAILMSAVTTTSAAASATESTFRFYDGVTAFVSNADGKDFSVTVDIRDINIYESGPREVLIKVYNPDGKPVVREVIPDDGVASTAYRQPIGGWGHESWYYAHTRMQGSGPMMRWSAFSDPARLATIPKRTFRYDIKGTKPGVYRVLMAGATDHYVTMKIDPSLPFAVAGHPHWLHGRDNMYQHSVIYVPRGAIGMHMLLVEHDRPCSRKAVLRDSKGTTLLAGDASKGYVRTELTFEKPGQYDDQLLTLDVSAGKGDFLLDVKFRFAKDPEVAQRGTPAVTAVLANDEVTARAVRGGAIYHDGRVFWQMYQVRFYEWLKRLKPDDFVVKDSAGKTIAVDKLPQRDGFLNVNSHYWHPPLCDRVMHHYPAHKNRAALNLALKDLAAGLRSIGPNDHVSVAVGGPFSNMAYEFSNYAWHYWRPSWRVQQHSDAPDEVKKIVREAMIVCGDRLSFSRSWERVNGNAFAQLLAALRYCYEGTADPLQKQVFETYWQRFTSGGWGERVGVGKSGPVQEVFGYAYHYASYIVTTWQAINADLDDKRFRQVRDRIRNWFSYTLAAERIPAGPWSSRTHVYPHWAMETEGPYAWKGLPGPDFTDSVNDADEWFAARRKNYYLLTYHGRLGPKWSAHAGQAGYGGGMICQLHIPGKGPVLAATLNGDYGRKMHTSLWPTFHIHSIVGRTADDRSLVTADSEHFNAKLKGNTVTSSGEVRESSVHVSRGYTFGDNTIDCEVSLRETDVNELLSLWVANPFFGHVTEAYEMIPFVAKKLNRKDATTVTALDEKGKPLGPLTETVVTTKTIVIDRGGFGVRILLAIPHKVRLGQNSTILIHLAERTTPAAEIALKYRLEPFIAAN